MRAIPGLLLLLFLTSGCGDAAPKAAPPPPPPAATALPPAPAGLKEKLSASIDAAKPHANSVWRDQVTLNPDGTVNGYVEIPRGESTKWEFRIALNKREVDRMIPPELGGYPTNYGFIPRTISYDGDPTDVLVLGPPIAGGEIVKGRILGLMEMMDTGDLDSKVVVTPLDESGRPLFALEPADKARLEKFFSTYKNHDGKVTTVPGWGDADAALAFIRQTSAFFGDGSGLRR
jgi:inorganic pyrophosphatase